YTSQFDNSSVGDPRTLCNIFPGLTKRQRQICARDPTIVLSVAEGVRKGIQECQFQFQYYRWNCTVFPNDLSLFGNALVKGIVTFFQTSFPSDPHASHPISQYQTYRLAQNEFKWKGCDEDLKFSTNFVRRFADAQEHSLRDIKAVTTRHNNRVGRYILKKNASKFCKCHGLSGSCSMRTCWQSITNLRAISSEIRDKYDSAVEVAFDPSGKPVPQEAGHRAPRKTDLMYYEKSKDFCTPDVTRGILVHSVGGFKLHKTHETPIYFLILTGIMGTNRRPCKTESLGEESCDILCCGQEYSVVRLQYTEKCNCVFKWCCEVKCEKCNVTRYENFCT
ncbi:Protein Wnt-2b, partial [Orchesella cincta]